MKHRRREGKTDYQARINMLKSGKARIVFRKTNKYVIGQYVKSDEAKDKVILGITSNALLGFGWHSSHKGSLKSIPACYLTGFLLGKEMLDRDEKEGIFDLGLLRNVKKSRAYAFLKGIADAGIKIKCKEETFPGEDRIEGRHLKINLEFKKIKANIEKKFV